MSDSEPTKSWYNLIADTYILERRKNWYSEVACTYNRVRPRYPNQLISRVVELAQLQNNAIILEVGCGPGIATVPFAQLGFSMVCLEPSQEACQLAQLNCTEYPHVEIVNTTFEEWELEPKRFNAVLAATSFHWISPEIAYSKTAAALQDNGFLILLWNTPPQPSYEVCQVLDEVYKTHAPSVYAYEKIETHQENLRQFGQNVIDSGRFKGLVSEQMVCEATYSIDDYLALLSTLSPYIKLDAQPRESLFAGLRERLVENCSDGMHLSYLSAFQVAQKV